jgi:hypothetical protein
MSTLFANNKPVAPKLITVGGSKIATKTEPRFYSVEVFNGLQRSEQKFTAPGGE